MGRLKGLDSKTLKPKISQWLERVELADVSRKKCEELSKGMQQKVQFIASVLHEPELIILDEPFSGLDPVNLRLLRDLINEQHLNGKTVIFSTHVMHHAEHICDHIVMIHQGQKVLDDSLSTIRQRFDPRAIHLTPIDNLDESLTKVQSLPSVAAVSKIEEHLEVQIPDGTVPQETIRSIVSEIPVRNIEIKQPTLEDIFIEIVTGGKAQDQTQRQEILKGTTDDEETQS